MPKNEVFQSKSNRESASTPPADTRFSFIVLPEEYLEKGRAAWARYGIWEVQAREQ